MWDWPGCSWRWCSGLDLLPLLGSSAPPGFLGLSSQPTAMSSTGGGAEKALHTDICMATHWVGWFCICPWSYVLEHQALPSLRSWEGFSERKTRSWFIIFHKSKEKHMWTSCFQGKWCSFTWYSEFSVFVSLAACCSMACWRGREEVWSSWSHTSLGVETEQIGSTPNVLTSNCSERLEPRLSKLGR